MKKNRKRDGVDLEKLVFEVAEKALSSPDMPEASIHFARLQREGHAAEDAKRMIGTVLVTSISFAKMKNVPCDREQIRSELARLPKIGTAPDGRILDIRGLGASV